MTVRSLLIRGLFVGFALFMVSVYFGAHPEENWRETLPKMFLCVFVGYLTSRSSDTARRVEEIQEKLDEINERLKKLP